MVVLTFAVVGGVLSLVFGNFIHFSADTGISVTAPAHPPSSNAVVYNPPAPQDAPEDIRDAVMLGYNILVDTPKYAAAYTTKSKLRCVSCHFKGGITEGGKNGGLSLVGVGAVYPRYRFRQHYAGDLVTRTNSCFERSMNGKPVPPDSREMTAILTYYQWISKDLPVYGDIPWLGLRKVKEAGPGQGQGGLVYGKNAPPATAVRGREPGLPRRSGGTNRLTTARECRILRPCPLLHISICRSNIRN